MKAWIERTMHETVDEDDVVEDAEEATWLVEHLDWGFDGDWMGEILDAVEDIERIKREEVEEEERRMEILREEAEAEAAYLATI